MDRMCTYHTLKVCLLYPWQLHPSDLSQAAKILHPKLFPVFQGYLQHCLEPCPISAQQFPGMSGAQTIRLKRSILIDSNYCLCGENDCTFQILKWLWLYSSSADLNSCQLASTNISIDCCEINGQICLFVSCWGFEIARDTTQTELTVHSLPYK